MRCSTFTSMQNRPLTRENVQFKILIPNISKLSDKPKFENSIYFRMAQHNNDRVTTTQRSSSLSSHTLVCVERIEPFQNFQRSSAFICDQQRSLNAHGDSITMVQR